MNRCLFRLIGIGIGFLGLSSCAALQGPETVTQAQPLEPPAAQAAPSAESAAAAEERQLPPQVGPDGNGEELFLTQTEMAPRPENGAQPGAPETPPVERNGPLFSLSAQDADIQTVLMAFSKEVKQNIVFDPDIRQKVTVELKDVTLEEALDHLLKPLRLEWKREGDFIHVTRQKMETRMFKLNYIISRRQGLSNLQATSGQGTAGTTTLGVGGGAAGLGNLNTGTAGTGIGVGAGAGAGRTFNNLFTSEETDLWREIFFGLRRMVTGAGGQGDRPDITQQGTTGGLGAATAGVGGIGQTAETESGSALETSPKDKGPKGYFSLNRQAGVIVVKDYPDVLMQIAEFLEEVEGSSQRQVFILAKILEVNLRDEFRLGIDWSQVSPITVIHDNDPGINQQFNDSFNLTRALSGPLGTFIQGASGFFYGLSNTQMNIMIDALSRQGNVSVLSSPKIATLNNQRAVIKVGTEDVFFIPQITPASTTTPAFTTFVPSSITIGIVLDVLPQINEDGKVMMSINTSVSERAGERISPDGTNAIPIVDVRESNNVVLAQSGQTIVIGGLMKNKKTKNENELPFLGRLPLLGRLFQHEEDIDEKTELVIMLTPQVMAGMAIDERLKKEEEHLQKVVTPNG